MFRLGLMVVAFMMTACGGPRYIDFFPYSDDGQPKPRVVLLPVVDSVSYDTDLPSSLEQGIKYQAMDSGQLYFLRDDEIPCDIRRLPKVDYFGTDLSFTREMRCSEFVVIVEILECNFKKPSLLEKVRVRVIDLRYQTPIVVLQEVIHNEFRTINANSRQTCIKFSADIVARLEDVLGSIH